MLAARRAFLLCALLYTGGVAPASAGELTLTTDQKPLIFGAMRLGEFKDLADVGSYHTTVTCTSSNGQPWYLKISLARSLTAGTVSMPEEQLQWELVATDGQGSVIASNQLKPFSLTPELVYQSAGTERSGQPVEFQFRYRLSLPEHQVRGFYQATVRFIITEVL